MTEFRADLHCHTTCSDGSVTPEKIIELALERELQGLSITDHDSINAYATAIPAAQKLGISLITGVEFSSMHKDSTVHILGYSFSPTNPIILHLCERHQTRRLERNRAILERLAAHGMPLSEEEINACEGTVGRPHIAAAMVKKGYVETVTNAFHLYIGEGKPCYVRGASFPVEEAISSIHQANGFAIIAHPHLIKEPHLVQALLTMDFDGLEGYYAKLPAAQNDRWVKIANKKNWIISGGSDFHGDIKPSIPLGCSWVGDETFRVLKTRFDTNQETG